MSFIKSFEQEGYLVDNFFDFSYPNFKKNIVHKVKNFIQRKVFKNNNYYLDIEKAYINQQIIKRSEALSKNQYDFSIFFRADLYPEKVIKNIRAISKKMITDQYDGMAVCSNILNYLKYFDRYFLFDPKDYKEYKHLGFLPITNCWFSDENITNKIEQDLFYVGVGIDERKEKILKLQSFLNGKHSLKALLTIPLYRNEEKSGGVKFSHTGLSYEENISEVKKSRALIDFKLDYHDGLSFRFFEALYYQKKIITNNKAVTNYDFYHPNNIFICDFNNFDGLLDFLEKPYHKIDGKMVEKYSVKNWLRYILDIQPHTPLTLPKI